jgi:hypothetical protein
MVVPEGCPLDIDPIEIGKLIQKVEQLELAVRTNNAKLDRMESQLERGRGIAIGIVIAVAGLGGIGGSVLTRWMSG